MKKILTIVFFLTALTSSIVLTSCNNSVIDPNVVANPYLVSYTIQVRDLDPIGTDSNTVDLLTGRVLNDTAYLRDVEVVDSLLSGRLYFRSGDGTNPMLDNIGYETMFTTGYNIGSFDTLTTLPYNTGTIVPADFSRHTTYGFDEGGTTYNTYGVYLKGKSAARGGANIYGIFNIGPTILLDNGRRSTTINVKLNTNGQNDFRTFLTQ